MNTIFAGFLFFPFSKKTNKNERYRKAIERCQLIVDEPITSFVGNPRRYVFAIENEEKELDFLFAGTCYYHQETDEYSIVDIDSYAKGSPSETTIRYYTQLLTSFMKYAHPFRIDRFDDYAGRKFRQDKESWDAYQSNYGKRHIEWIEPPVQAAY